MARWGARHTLSRYRHTLEFPSITKTFMVGQWAMPPSSNKKIPVLPNLNACLSCSLFFGCPTYKNAETLRNLKLVTNFTRYILLITRVSVRYGEIFHELKASEMFRNISRETSVICDLSYTDEKCEHAVEH